MCQISQNDGAAWTRLKVLKGRETEESVMGKKRIQGSASRLGVELPPEGLIRAKKAALIFGIGQSTWWSWVASGRAPKGIKLGSRTTVWRVEDVRALLKELGGTSDAA